MKPAQRIMCWAEDAQPKISEARRNYDARESIERTVKNGCIHNGKQNHRCKDCGRQFVEDPLNKVISPGTKELIDKPLLEKLPLAGIARVAEVSEPWLQGYVHRKHETVPKQVESRLKKGDAYSGFQKP